MSSTELRLLFLMGAFLATITTTRALIHRNTYKGLNGVVPTDEILAAGLNRTVYYHEQVVAVVDFNKNYKINNCDIIEAYEPREMREIMTNLSMSVRPMRVTFEDMTALMLRCEQLDWMQRNGSTGNQVPKGTVAKANFYSNLLNLLSGIFPGTNWCGTGDAAQNYHDLGPEADLDSCCRTHDLCPVKIRSKSSRYNLTNYSLYSKSHCACDKIFFHCLKSVKSPIAETVGKIYFNIGRVECLDDSEGSSKKISTTGLRF